MTDYADRAELRRVQDRLDAIDQMGTRGVAVLAVQLQEIAKDVATLQRDILDHRSSHEQAERARLEALGTARRNRNASRRWIIGAVIAIVGAIDGPLVTVLLAIHWH